MGQLSSPSRGGSALAILSDLPQAEQKISAPLHARSRLDSSLARFPSPQSFPTNAVYLSGLNGIVLDQFDSASLSQAQVFVGFLFELGQFGAQRLEIVRRLWLIAVDGRLIRLLVAWGWREKIIGLHGHRPKYMMKRTQNVSRTASSFKHGGPPRPRRTLRHQCGSAARRVASHHVA